MIENVIIYQLISVDGLCYSKIRAYIPQDQPDYERCVALGDAGHTIEVLDVFNAQDYDDIRNKMDEYTFCEENVKTWLGSEREIFDARK